MLALGNGIGLPFNRTQGGGGGGIPYIADKYSGIHSAHSFVKASESYSGDCLQVQRNSDGTYLEVGWINDICDFSAIETFSAGTDTRITKWYDSSGNGNYLEEATAGYQPYIYLSGVLKIQDNGIIWATGTQRVKMYSLSLRSKNPLDMYTSLTVTGTYNNGIGYIGVVGRTSKFTGRIAMGAGIVTLNAGSPDYYLNGVDVSSYLTNDLYSATLDTASVFTIIGMDTSLMAANKPSVMGIETTKWQFTHGIFRNAYFFTTDSSAERENIEADIAVINSIDIT